METKTTKEIYKYVRKGIETHNVLDDIEIASHARDKWVRVDDVIQELIDFGAQEKSLFDFYIYMNDKLTGKK